MPRSDREGFDGVCVALSQGQIQNVLKGSMVPLSLCQKEKVLKGGDIWLSLGDIENILMGGLVTLSLCQRECSEERLCSIICRSYREDSKGRLHPTISKVR